jgi:hypothetical protein
MPSTVKSMPPASKLEPEQLLDYARLQQQKQAKLDRQTPRGQLNHAKFALLRDTRPAPAPEKTPMKHPILGISAAFASGYLAGRSKVVKRLAAAAIGKIVVGQVLRRLR